MSRCPIIFEIPARKGWIGPFLEHVVVVDVVDVVDVVFGVVVRVARQRGEELPRRPHLGADLHGADGPRRRLQGCQPGRQLRLPAVGRQLHPPHRSRTLFFLFVVVVVVVAGLRRTAFPLPKKKQRRRKTKDSDAHEDALPFTPTCSTRPGSAKQWGNMADLLGDQ